MSGPRLARRVLLAWQLPHRSPAWPVQAPSRGACAPRPLA